MARKPAWWTESVVPSEVHAELMAAFDGLDIKDKVYVVLAAVESGVLTAKQALPCFARLWTGAILAVDPPDLGRTESG